MLADGEVMSALMDALYVFLVIGVVAFCVGVYYWDKGDY